MASSAFLRWAGATAVVLGCISTLWGCGGGSGGGGGGATQPPPPESGCSAWSGSLDLGADVAHSAIHAVAVTHACSYVIAGYERSTHPGEPQGDSRGFVRLLAVDPSGTTRWQWEYLLDTPDADAVLGIEVVDGDIRFWGTTEAAVPGEANLGKKDVVLGVLDLDGRLVKLSQLGNERPNVPLVLLTTASGEQFLVGNDEVYVPTNYVETWEDPWLASITEYPTFHALNWMANLETAVADLYTDAVAHGESVIVAIRTAAGPDRGIRVQRRSPTGEVIWTTRLSDSPYDTVAALTPGSGDGRVSVFGSTYLQLGDAAAGDADYFIASIDVEDGGMLWLRQFGTAAPDWSRRLLASPAGLTAIGEVMDTEGNWSIDIRALTRDGVVTRTRTLRPGGSARVLAAASAPQGVVVSGAYATAGGGSRGFLRLAADGT
jgi:hypothetical protein